MEQKKIYNWATLLRNRNGGKPMLKNNEQIFNDNGELVLIPEFVGYLKIDQTLPVGEYEIKFREKVAQSGTTYFAGGILPKKENSYKPNQHQQAKQNGYQKQPEIKSNDFDEIPF